MAISQKQQLYLLDRLQEARRSKPSQYQESEGYKVPVAVAQAKKAIEKSELIIRKHNEVRRKVRDVRNKKIAELYNIVKETIMFGDEKKALAALKAFENRKF